MACGRPLAPASMTLAGPVPTSPSLCWRLSWHQLAEGNTSEVTRTALCIIVMRTLQATIVAIILFDRLQHFQKEHVLVNLHAVFVACIVCCTFQLHALAPSCNGSPDTPTLQLVQPCMSIAVNFALMPSWTIHKNPKASGCLLCAFSTSLQSLHDRPVQTA